MSTNTGYKNVTEAGGSCSEPALGQAEVFIFEWDILTDTLVCTQSGRAKTSNESVYRGISRVITASRYIHPEDMHVLTALQKDVKKGVLYSTADFRFTDLKEGYKWYRIHIVNQYDSEEKPCKASGMVFDINEEVKAMEKLRLRAERDALTGVYNREETETLVRQHLQAKPSELCALFMIDTDNFKQINDTKGHMLGDVVLAEIANGMKKLMRESDIVGRIGGDEFTIFMKNIPSPEAAEKKAQELTEMFRSLFSGEKKSLQVTCSIGVAVSPNDGRDFKTLYNCADQALYQAKSRGKNRYMMYDRSFKVQIGDAGVSSLGAAIDSEAESAEVSGTLASYVFKILYNTEDVDQAINMILEIVGKRFDVSRAYVFENTDDEKYCSNTYEWCNEGIEPEIGTLQHIEYSLLGHYEKLFEENSIFYCRDTSSLQVPEQVELFQRQNIHATLQCAFRDGEKFRGFVGFDECTGFRLWTKDEVSALSLICQILTTFLQKKRSLERNRELEMQLHTILDSQDACIYVINRESRELLYMNQKAKYAMPGAGTGQYCYNAFYGKKQPCKDCPIDNKEIQYADMHISPMKWRGEEACLFSSRGMSDEGTFKRGDVLENMTAEKGITECIRLLTSSEYLEDSIEYVLEIVRAYYQPDRVYIVELDEEQGIANNTYEICAEGVQPQIDNLQRVPLDAISFWPSQFEARGYIKIEDIENLGEDRRQEYEILKEQGINSLLAIPLNIKGELKGFLGIDDPKKHKDNVQYLEEISYFLENEISKTILRRKLEKLSYQDSLTGLENRNSYMSYCDNFTEYGSLPAGIIFMDINGLKKLNDSKGHIYGDMLIMHIAEEMQHFFPDARKFRLSGDEFLIVTESMTYKEFRQRLSSMIEKLSENGNCIIAAGTSWSDVRADLAELVNKADRMMYLNKQEYYRTNQEIAKEKIPLLKDLMDSILNQEYLIYLQPKLNANSGQVDSAEVLVRYRKKDGTISSPARFIPLLESEGLISYIDFFVLKEVCRLLVNWKNTNLCNMQLSLNFSRITLLEEHFLEQFMEIFQEYDLRPGQLEIEVTETQETLNKKQMVYLLKELKSQGFNIVLDDFGVEYSSYEFLMMSGLDLLKIDKGVVQKYQKTQKGSTIIKHIVNMSHDIGIPCCAEGVETEEQLRFMKRIGCDYIQGYLIDKPLPLEQFEEKYRHPQQLDGQARPV